MSTFIAILASIAEFIPSPLLRTSIGAIIGALLGSLLLGALPSVAVRWKKETAEVEKSSVAAGPGGIAVGTQSGGNNTINNNYYGSKDDIAALAFQKLTIFFVHLDANVLQIGVVAKVYNPNNKSRRLGGMTFNGRRWSLFPRGGYLLARIRQNGGQAEVLEDNFTTPNSPSYFKQLLPLKFEMETVGPPPDLVLRGAWTFLVDDKREAPTPEFYCTFDRVISVGEWESILKPQTTINPETCPYKPLPPEPNLKDPVGFFLVYNSDRSAKITNPYYDQTPSYKNEHGVMTFIGLNGMPHLDSGWTILGRTYAEVWADPDKLKLYNSIYPPDQNGLPQPFGFFSGAENTMAGPVGRSLFAATTRGADKMDFYFDGVPR